MALASSVFSAETVQFRPVADTTLIENAPNSSLGADDFINVGTTGIGTLNRSLLLFDLEGAIPVDATVISATLQFEVVFIPQTDQARGSILGVYRMMTDWGEGTQLAENPFAPGFGTPAINGEATWNTPHFGSGETWGTPGGLSGVDYFGSASATTTIEDENLYMFNSLPRLVEDVQGWVANPDDNLGWMLKVLFENDVYTARRVGAREDAFAAPLLTVTFEPVPEPAMLALWMSFFVAGCVVMPRIRRA